MKQTKVLLIMTLVVAMLLPTLAFAGHGNSQRDACPDNSNCEPGSSGSGYQSGGGNDERGIARSFGDGTWFMWQVEAFLRYMSRWNW